MKRPGLLLLLNLACLSLFGQRISVQPSILDFHLGPSGIQSQVVEVTNSSDRKLTFQVYLGDWLRDSTGGHQYFRADTLKRSCASWVKLSRNFLELQPKETSQIIVQMQAPSDSMALKQMKWAMLFIHMVEEQDITGRNSKNLQASVKEMLRIGVHIYQTPPQLVKKKVRTINFRQVPEEANTYELKMRNTGEVMLMCKSYLDLTDVATGKQYKTAPIEFPVFPDGTRKVKHTIPATIPPGKYSALAVLDIGEDMPLEAVEKSIEVKNPVVNSISRN